MAPNLLPVIEERLNAEPGGQGAFMSISPGLLARLVPGGGFGGGSGLAAQSSLVLIGVALEALLWAYLGGWAACYFASGPDGALTRRAPSTT
jgi:hypothetical protein